MTLTAVPSAGSKVRGSVLSSLITEVRPISARVTVEQSLATSSTTLANVTELFIALAANAEYEVLVVLSASVSSGSTEDIQYAFTFPAGATVDYFTHGPGTTATTSTVAPDMQTLSRIDAVSGTTAVAIGTTTSTAVSFIHMHVTTSTTAGTLQVQAAQNTSGGNTVKVNKGSYMVARRLS